jgi:hypothetical protein
MIAAAWPVDCARKQRQGWPGWPRGLGGNPLGRCRGTLLHDRSHAGAGPWREGPAMKRVSEQIGLVEPKIGWILGLGPVSDVYKR